LSLNVSNQYGELLGSGELNLYKDIFIRREKNLKKWVAIISAPGSQKVSELMAKMSGATSNQMKILLRITINYNGKQKEATEPEPIYVPDEIKNAISGNSKDSPERVSYIDPIGYKVLNPKFGAVNPYAIQKRDPKTEHKKQINNSLNFVNNVERKFYFDEANELEKSKPKKQKSKSVGNENKKNIPNESPSI